MPRRSENSQQRTVGYSLYRQKEGARITWWPDPRGPGHGKMLWGTVISHIGTTVTIIWDNDDEHFEVWDSKECRYRVDRGQMRFIPPPKERRLRIPDSELLCKTCGKPRSEKCGCPRPGALKPEHWGKTTVLPQLTQSRGNDMMEISNEGTTPHDPKGVMMAKKKPEVVEELEPLEELSDATEEVTGASSEDKMTAKAAATELGTNGRTLRKFLRKEHGTIGQGQRWEIDKDSIEELRVKFNAWSKGGGGTKAEKADKPKPTKQAEPEPDAELDELEEIDDLDFEE